jgi:hypothetical protein
LTFSQVLCYSAYKQQRWSREQGVPRPSGPLSKPYIMLKSVASRDLGGAATDDALRYLVSISLKFLASDCVSVPLISLVPGKKYYSYALKTNPPALSRPVNQALFEANFETIENNWENPHSLTTIQLARLYYTMATAYSIGSDLFDRNNKKAPATYFELFIGHIFARELGQNPVKHATLHLGSGKKVKMTMDFIFDLGPGKAKVHLPVKMSTRERVVQAWAHQRLLDAAYGEGVFQAILVVHSDTKLDLQTREVIEITVPEQWLAYQTLLAKMKRIYYLDVPDRYLKLSKSYPIIQLKHFSAFFSEKEKLLITSPKKFLST